MKKLLLLVALSCSPICASAAQDGVTAVAASDRAMNAAIADARKKLPIFWSKLQKSVEAESDFSLKIRIEDKNGIEHFGVVKFSERTVD